MSKHSILDDSANCSKATVMILARFTISFKTVNREISLLCIVLRWNLHLIEHYINKSVLVFNIHCIVSIS